MGQHTPGPWMALVQADWPYKQAVHVTAEGWGAVATVNLDPTLLPIEQQRANLRLITVAPDLYAAQAELTDAVECAYEAIYESLADGPVPEWFVRLEHAAKRSRAALAAAQGSQQ